MKVIELTRGHVAIVDDEDFEKLAQYRWRSSGRYAVRWSPMVDGKRMMMQMHSEIVKTPKGMFTDHVNLNGFDNRRSNLRLCTPQQNSWNCGPRKRNKFGSKGVTWHKRNGKYQAQIKENNKLLYLGQFDTVQEAAIAHNKEAVRIHGEFVRV